VEAGERVGEAVGGDVGGTVVGLLVVLLVVLASILATQSAVLAGVRLDTGFTLYFVPNTDSLVSAGDFSSLTEVTSGDSLLLVFFPLVSFLSVRVKGLRVGWEGVAKFVGASVRGSVWEGGVGMGVVAVVGRTVVEVNSGKGVNGSKAKLEILSLGLRFWTA